MRKIKQFWQNRSTKDKRAYKFNTYLWSAIFVVSALTGIWPVILIFLAFIGVFFVLPGFLLSKI